MVISMVAIGNIVHAFIGGTRYMPQKGLTESTGQDKFLQTLAYLRLEDKKYAYKCCCCCAG